VVAGAGALALALAVVVAPPSWDRVLLATNQQLRRYAGPEALAGGPAAWTAAAHARYPQLLAWHEDVDQQVAVLRRRDPTGATSIDLFTNGQAEASFPEAGGEDPDVANEVLVVTTPEPTAITDAYGLIKAIDQHNPLARVQLMINMVESEQEARAVAQKLIMIVNRFLNIDVSYLTYMEKDPNISRSVLQQQPFYQAFPYGPSTRRINMLASLLVEPEEGNEPPPATTSFFTRLAKLFR